MEKKDQQSKTHNQPEKRSGQQPQKQNQGQPDKRQFPNYEKPQHRARNDGRRHMVERQTRLQFFPAAFRGGPRLRCAASRTSESLCENSMKIFKLLSEEVFDFARLDLTQVDGGWACFMLMFGDPT